MKTVYQEAIKLLEELTERQVEIRNELPKHLTTIIRALGIEDSVLSSKYIPKGTIIIGTGEDPLKSMIPPPFSETSNN